jgi:hypothetical protein
MTSFIKIASNSGQAEDLAHSTIYQALAMDKNSPKNYDTTKLVKSWHSQVPIAVKLLSGQSQPSIAFKLLNLSMLTPKAKLSPIQSNSAIPTFPSLHHPQRIESAMAFRLLPEPSQWRRLPEVSPRWMQSSTFKTSSNLGICTRHRPAGPCIPQPLAVQACNHMNLQG